MKKLILVTFFVTLLLFSCAQKDEGIKLEKGTHEYELAEALAKRLPALDPDSNKILIITNQFNITTGSVVDALYKNFHSKLDQLKNLSAIRLKKIFADNAEAISKKKMLLMEVENAGIHTSEAKIDSAMQVEFEKAGGKEKYVEYLSQNNITLDFVKEDYKNSFNIQTYLENAVDHLTTVSDSEVQNQMMQIQFVSVRHILLKTIDKSKSEKAQIRKKMEKILDKAKKGENFSRLARQYSEDTGSKENGGLYKNFKRGDMVKSFEDVSFSVPIGEISDIFETSFGYHILEVVDRKKDSRSAEEIKADLKKIKQDKVITEHIKYLKKEFEFTIVNL